MIAAAGQVGRRCAFMAGPTEHVDDRFAVLVDNYSGALVIQVIHPSADEPISLRFEIGDHGRDVGMTRKPRFHRVLVGGYHVDEMGRHQRTHMGAHQLVEQWIGEPRRQEQKRKGRRDGRSARSAEGARPKRPRAPIR